MKKRRIARELCLQSLYLADTTSVGFDEILSIVSNGHQNSKDIMEFYSRLFKASTDRKSEIDRLISSKVKNWDISRMLPIDRNIIRAAVCEMVVLKTAPVAVIIDEAIEIAKKFSTKESGKFVNGVLDSIAKNLQATND